VRAEVQELAGRMDAAWGAEDPDAAVAALFADDGVLYDMVAPDDPARGREAIAAALHEVTSAFSDLAFQSEVVCDDGERVCVEWKGTGTHDGQFGDVAPTGRKIDLRGVNLWRLNGDGTIAEERSYWDLATLLRQIGELGE
jgi:steroid delta-isomerase-like uncharacterized protein